MDDDWLQQCMGRGVTALFGMVLGGMGAWLYGWWKRHRERRNVQAGDARDTVVIEHHLVESTRGSDGRLSAAVLRMRSLGQDQLERVVPNGHLAAEFLLRACRTTPRRTLISMEGAEGSYLLETLTNFVCDRIGTNTLPHDLYVMAPCCEPAGLVVHQPIVVILIALKDLEAFETWRGCRAVRVEHGSDGARVLTLMELARRFRDERRRIEARKRRGLRTTYMESCYLLDLALDKRFAPLPVQKVAWERFLEARVPAGEESVAENRAILETGRMIRRGNESIPACAGRDP